MNAEKMKTDVFAANQKLREYSLAPLTWGNVSEIHRGEGIVVIKPSGVEYADMRPEDMVVTDLTGCVKEGRLRPSSDLATHLALYRAFPEIRGIAHTHSRWATVFAQAGRGIPAFGTTHGDAFFGEIPCTRPMREVEITGEYEQNTGLVIAERFAVLDPTLMPGVLVRSHGPFTWGKSGAEAVQNAAALEEIAMMAFHTLALGQNIPMEDALLRRHFFRKHGKDSYYGQNNV